MGDFIGRKLEKNEEIICTYCEHPANYKECADVIRFHKNERNLKEKLNEEFSKKIEIEESEKKQKYIYCCECGEQQQPGSYQIIKCKKCEKQTCVKHSMPSYKKSKLLNQNDNQSPESDYCCAGGKFEDEERKKSELNATEEFLKGNTIFKSCPHCKSILFKDGGCNYVTCGGCKNGLCWATNKLRIDCGGGHNCHDI